MSSLPKPQDEARHALERSRKNLRVVIEENPEVSAVSRELRRIRERNHFGEMIALSMQRKQTI